jgi:hypothetical protein
VHADLLALFVPEEKEINPIAQSGKAKRGGV